MIVLTPATLAVAEEFEREIGQLQRVMLRFTTDNRPVTKLEAELCRDAADAIRELYICRDRIIADDLKAYKERAK